MEFGSYDPHHFCVNVPHFGADLALDERGIAQFVRDHPDIDVQVDRAMRDVTILHELRHFHDCLGTLSGLGLFEAHISRLQAFGQVMKQLHERKIGLKLPLSEWVAEPGCPDFVQEFFRRISGGAFLDAAFCGRYPGMRLRGRHPDALVNVPFRKLVLPGFPAHVRASYQSDDGAWHAGEDMTEVLPVGFDQLVEGNAQALQRTLLDSCWPAQVSQRAWQRLTQAAGPVHAAADLLGSIVRLPYNTTDLMLSKHLANRHGITGFPRAWLTQLSDHALMFGRCLPYGVRGDFLPPGGAFVTAMERLDWGRCSRTARLDLPDTRPVCEALLASIRERPAPASFLPARGLQEILGYIDAYAHHCVAAPILALRVAEGNRILDNAHDYADNYTRLPMAPMVVTRAGVREIEGLPSDFRRVWSSYVMFSEVAQQIWADRGHISCPRADESVAALRFASFTYDAGDNCGSQIARGACVPWHRARRAALPNCHFRTQLRLLGLVAVTAA